MAASPKCDLSLYQQFYSPSTTWWEVSLCAAVHLRKPSANWLAFLLPQTSHRLQIWLDIQFCFLTEYLLDFSHKANILISFVHILQMNWNSAFQDHRFSSVDIKSIRAGQMSANSNVTATAFCHQATVTLGTLGLCYLMRWSTLYWYLHLKNWSEK